MSLEKSELEKYLHEMKRIGSDLEKVMRSAAGDIDRLGRDAVKEATENAKKGGVEAERALRRLEQEWKEGGPTIKKEMEDLQHLMNETVAKVEREIKKYLK